MRNLFLAAMLAITGAFSGLALANEQFIDGKNFVSLRNQVATQSADKIEVIEFFWYGCGWCEQLEPAVKSWEKRLADDVNFIRVPAMFGGVWDLHAQMFYALEAVNARADLHDAIFVALHKQNKRLSNLKEITAFVSEHGVDADEFTKAWNSFSVKTNLQKAKRLAISYQIASVPTMAVNGKYSFDISSSGGLVETTQVADFLIQQERN